MNLQIAQSDFGHTGRGLVRNPLPRRCASAQFAAGTSQPAIARYEAGQARPRFETAQRCVEACGFVLRTELERTSPQRRAAAEAALARSVEDRLRTNDAFTRFAAELRRG
ncbi:MAG: helix-turn-helix domain-containing protein [Acidobacteria bacterium]|nr:helix-turn-helix domain-containing protein [Acidobacteriota bacterium]